MWVLGVRAPTMENPKHGIWSTTHVIYRFYAKASDGEILGFIAKHKIFEYVIDNLTGINCSI